MTQPPTASQAGESKPMVQAPPLHGLQPVSIDHGNIDLTFAYEQVLGTERLDELRELACTLKNIKVAHVNATAYGGGVAELLHRQIPLMNQLGEECGFTNDWYVLNTSSPKFYDVTKKMHNALQGALGTLTEEEEDLYWRIQEENFSSGLLTDYQVVIVHDPQPVGLIDAYREVSTHTKWAWRCHIDTSQHNPAVWGFIAPSVAQYDAVIFTRRQFARSLEDLPPLTIIPPSIDPLSPKNSQLRKREINEIFKRYGIDPARPVMVQVSRFDPWKQPLEVVEIYQELKAGEFPDLQLVYAGSMATDDPEGMLYWEKTLRKAGEDDDVIVLNNYHGVGNKEINAFQTGADVVLQYSSKEGFGLTVSEAMWKEQPVIGGKVGGIQDQITHGETGYLVSTDREVKDAIRELLKNPDKRKAMGKQAKERVAENFLITREVTDYMRLIKQLSEGMKGR